MSAKSFIVIIYNCLGPFCKASFCKYNTKVGMNVRSYRHSVIANLDNWVCLVFLYFMFLIIQYILFHYIKKNPKTLYMLNINVGKLNYILKKPVNIT